TNATAFGNLTEARGMVSTTMGYGSVAQGNWSLAAGYRANSVADFSFAMGENTKSRSQNSFVVGRNNDTTAINSLFEIGNGTADNARSNAMTVLQGGNVGIGTTNPNAALQFSNSAVNRKIVLYEGANNDHQYDGFGINGGTLRYQVDGPGASHVFFAGVNSTASKELMRIQGTGNVGIGTTNPVKPLSFPAALGEKILLYPGGTGEV